MSSPTAIATVTAVLQHLLIQATAGANITTKPPSAARDGGNGNQLNLFLYATHIDPALSNMPLPGQVRNGESAAPPLPLVLYYLLTAYGANDDDIAGQGLLGQAMIALHDHPLLGTADIAGILPDSGVQNQIERLRISPAVLSLDDMSKLWSSFQTEYHLSTSYQVSVLVMESGRAATAPLPVLRRGEQDRGAQVTGAATPTLMGLVFPNDAPAARLGDAVTIKGAQLAADTLTARFQHPLLTDPIDLIPLAERKADEIQVRLPDQAADAAVGSKWPAGFYTLNLVVQRAGLPEWSTNTLAMPLAPRITSISPVTAPAGSVTLTIECVPQVRPGQRVALVFGARTIAPQPFTQPADPNAPGSLTFQISDAAARPEPYVLRLRVDGVDSIPVDFSGATPQFSDDQKVTIT
jgi:hypothetical protein